MWHRTRRRLIIFAVAWFVIGSVAVGYVWKFKRAEESYRMDLTMLIALTLVGTFLALGVWFDDWRLRRK